MLIDTCLAIDCRSVLPFHSSLRMIYHGGNNGVGGNGGHQDTGHHTSQAEPTMYAESSDDDS